MEKEDFIPVKRGNYYQFPILVGNEFIGEKVFMIEHKYDGIAKLEHIREVAHFGGWGVTQACLPIGEVNWQEGETLFPSDTKEIFVLKSRLIMN